ncbi:MAG: sulfur carrier protein ThiS [Bacteroidales bacterium]|nr:sulfur carrier protein ThiS [Bacteroidales bacterium]
MKIILNSESREVALDATLQSAMEELSVPTKGVAVAVNNKMVPRTQWADFQLKENDALIVIKAACGG